MYVVLPTPEKNHISVKLCSSAAQKHVSWVRSHFVDKVKVLFGQSTVVLGSG